MLLIFDKTLIALSEKSKNIVALILAAGESKRLGKPKQLLKWNNTTLLNHINNQFKNTQIDKTFIVLGAYSKEIIEKCELTNAEIIEFKAWKEGMGSSLAFACNRIKEITNFDGILITLSDLPLVNQKDYQNMIELFSCSDDIVATDSGKSVGVPAILGSQYLNELILLNGRVGAKSIIHKNRRDLKIYKNRNAGIDIDTTRDYADFIENKS